VNREKNEGVKEESKCQLTCMPMELLIDTHCLSHTVTHTKTHLKCSYKGIPATRATVWGNTILTLQNKVQLHHVRACRSQYHYAQCVC